MTNSLISRETGGRRGPGVAEDKVLIDWCRFTFSVAGDEDAIAKATDFFCDAFAAVDLVPAPAFGQMAYTQGVAYAVGVGRTAVRCASLFYGGDRTNGTACIDINGRGCSLLKEWGAVAAWVDRLGAKLTRVDTALDFHEGQWTIGDAVQALTSSGFNAGGREPSSSCMGDWICHQGKGRTLMVGKRENGKQARVYEKGKQLGDAESGWLRFEVEWLSTRRVLPVALLTNPARYFAGAYPVCARLLALGGTRIKTRQLEGEYSEATMKHHLRRMYGKALYVLRRGYTCDSAMVEDLQRPGCPERLEKGALSGRVSRQLEVSNE